MLAINKGEADSWKSDAEDMQACSQDVLDHSGMHVSKPDLHHYEVPRLCSYADNIAAAAQQIGICTITLCASTGNRPFRFHICALKYCQLPTQLEQWCRGSSLACFLVLVRCHNETSDAVCTVMLADFSCRNSSCIQS